MTLAVPGQEESRGAGILAIAGLTKTFFGNRVLDDVSIVLEAGQVHALLGQNGAGKSTLIKILGGVYRADAGTVTVDGQRVTPGHHDVPVALIHQDLGLVADMTVAENMALVAGYRRRHHVISWEEVRRSAIEALGALNLDLDPGAPVGALPPAERSMVAIARALSMRKRFVVLDEPTAALPAADVDTLFKAIHQLRSQGAGFLYVTHRIDEVFTIADRVTVLRNGRVVFEDAVGKVSHDKLVASIVGPATPSPPARTTSRAPHRFPEATTGRAVLSVRGLVVGPAGPVDIEVRAGEVLGLVGLAGAGQVEIGRALVGALNPDRGEMEFENRSYSPRSPAAALGHGAMGFVPGDRLQEGIAASLSVQENLYLNPAVQGHTALRPISHRQERRRAVSLLKRFDVRPADPTIPIGLLSGGNQQKAVVVRWVGAKVRVMVLEDPTAGVDVGAKPEIHGILRDMRASGVAVVVVSSDFDELADICDRALVFRGGRVAAALERPEIDTTRLTMLASGAGIAASGRAL